jgi:hypothetical protein
VVGLITYFVPQVREKVELPEWELASFVLSSIVALRLLLAPYWIWKEDGDRILAEKKRADELLRRLDNKEVLVSQNASKRGILDDIAQAISYAVNNLANFRPLASGEPHAVDSLERAVDEWCTEVSEKLQNREVFNSGEQTHFDNLGFIQPIPYGQNNYRTLGASDVRRVAASPLPSFMRIG